VNFGNPPLSSVEPDAEQIGYRAAELLDNLMNGRANAEKHVRIHPCARSPDDPVNHLPLKDRTIAMAMRFITSGRFLLHGR